MSAEKKRLTVDVQSFFGLPEDFFEAYVRLDGTTVETFERDSESEARAAAEAYVAELLAHFRKGGT